MIDTNKMRNHIGDALVTPGLTILALLDEIDRLRGEQQTPPPWEKTVEVRFSAIVDHNGNVEIPRYGMSSGGYVDQQEFRQSGVPVKLTATLPVPAEVCVVARVEGE